MKLVSFLDPDRHPKIGWLVTQGIVDMKRHDDQLPIHMLDFIDHNDKYQALLPKHYLQVEPHYTKEEITLLPPLPNPRSFRDYIGFEMHMQNASRSFGHKIGEAWYKMPIFYFTNHQAIYGHDQEIKRPYGETKLDLELELACIIGKQGKDIKMEEANPYIFGYTIFNDWTARATQKIEMEVPLGPHKGKDFANAIGPCIVTADEMEKYRAPLNESLFLDPIRVPSIKLDRFDLKMEARINGTTICEGNYNTVYYTFEQMIERASQNGVNLMPGDILGSGTVGWGSLIENAFNVHRPLEPGDVVELEIEGIGVLRNKVII